MKGLRIICIFALVALFVLGSMGTAFAKGPQDDNHGKGIKDERQGFAGNVTDVGTGNVTIATEDKGDVTVKLIDDADYKIPREMNKWGNLTVFKSYLEGKTLSALEGRRVVALAGNGTGEWVVIKFMVLPVPGTQPMHAHHTGLVIEKLGSATAGNITIKDIHGGNHTFAIVTGTDYHPKGIGFANITADPIPPYANASFVTVVTKGAPKITEPPPVAQAIVLHTNRPADWPIPTP
jgi:hypothetical protein